jgi:DNA invertase Pin-like site-specific DNA recombinase
MDEKKRSENSNRDKVGYARVSSVGQNLDSQIDVLEKMGCERIFTDKMTGSRMQRPGWDELMRYVRPKDTIIITELSRMTRSLMDFLEISKVLEEKKIELVSLRENIDTNTVTGRCFLSIMGAIYQMERELRAERASAGRLAAKARGKSGGRPKTSHEKLENARILYENSDKTAKEVCESTGISKRTLFAYLAECREKSAS